MPRSKAFSGKQKKLQLKAKKQRKQDEAAGPGSSDEDAAVVIANKKSSTAQPGHSTDPTTSRQQQGPARLVESGRNRYALMFRSETEEAIQQSKKLAMKTMVPVCAEYLECSIEDFYTPELNIPIRPDWDYSLSKEQLESQERKYFNAYLKSIESIYEDSMSQLSYFELNLETWRQFWRVLEMSDILLCIVDIRFPPLLFPPKLYEFVCQKLGKNIILVLNKIDLAPASLVLAWKVYFETKYPQLRVICFTSFPSYNLRGPTDSSTTIAKGKKTKGRFKMAAEGALKLHSLCETFTGSQVDLSQWKEKILAEMSSPDHEDEAEMEIGTVEHAVPDVGYYEHKKFGGGILTIGCVGQPNVGKSSVINALMGKKVVSVSKTPGHTKHFQTIFLTANVRLCDCPGLVFPSRVPKPLQVLCGSFPIAQLRDATSVVKYLGERMNLPNILSISHPGGGGSWSAYDICEGWAIKRGYYTAKASRPDTSRAANHILRLALEGRVCLCLRPPKYGGQEEKWSQQPEIAEIESIQAKPKMAEETEEAGETEFSGGSDEEDAASNNGSDDDLTQPNKSKKSTVPITQVKNKFALLVDEGDGDSEDSEDDS